MSTGGIVTETINVPATNMHPARVWISTQEDTPEGVKCAIYVEDTAAARCVQDKDSIYWQGSQVFWSPRSRAFRDYPLKRLGVAGARRPIVKPLRYQPELDVSIEIKSLPSGRGTL